MQSFKDVSESQSRGYPNHDQNAISLRCVWNGSKYSAHNAILKYRRDHYLRYFSFFYSANCLLYNIDANVLDEPL